MRRAVFIDKDGTLVHDVPYNVDPAQVRYTADAMEGLRLLSDNGFVLVIVTNQPGVAMGLYGEAELSRLADAICLDMTAADAPLAGFYACPHAPGDDGAPACDCRKPRPGLLLRAARELDLDLGRSWMVGDILNDVEAGHRAGCRSVFMDVGNETEWKISRLRIPERHVSSLLGAARCIVRDSPAYPPATLAATLAAASTATTAPLPSLRSAG
jgi:D-glycero-D-manno-heptose 1,7-bisphosphate phosphatase